MNHETQQTNQVGYFEESAGHKSSARLNATLAISVGLLIALVQSIAGIWEPVVEVDVALITSLLALGFGGKSLSDYAKK